MLSNSYNYFQNTKTLSSSSNSNVFQYETYLGMGYSVIVGVPTGLVLSFIIAAVVWMLWKRKKKSNQVKGPEKGIKLILYVT